MSNIHSVIDQAFKDGLVERDNIRLHHTTQCDGHKVMIREHVTHLVYTPADGEHSVLLTSEPPFENWSPVEFPDQMKAFTVLSVVWDIQRNTMVLLMKDPNKVKALTF